MAGCDSLQCRHWCARLCLHGVPKSLVHSITSIPLTAQLAKFLLAPLRSGVVQKNESTKDFGLEFNTGQSFLKCPSPSHQVHFEDYLRKFCFRRAMSVSLANRTEAPKNSWYGSSFLDSQILLSTWLRAALKQKKTFAAGELRKRDFPLRIGQPAKMVEIFRSRKVELRLTAM